MLELRPLEEKDIATVNELAGKIWREHYPGIISPEQIEGMLELWYSEENLRRGLKNGHQYTMAILNGEPIGYISISKEKTPGDYFVQRFYIDRAQKGKGIGAAVYAHALKQLPDVERVSLRVNRRNIHPINAYFRMGFRIIAADTLELPQGWLMEDFIMRHDVKGAPHAYARAN